MKVTKSQLKELIRHTIVDLTEKTFGSKAQYDAYRKKHNLKPGSKHKVDGKTVTVRDVKKISKSAKKKADKFAAAQNAKLDAAEKAAKKKVKESKMRRYTVKEVRMWMKKLEENRYKKVYNSDARRVAWMVNNEGVELSEMPKSMSKKWTKAQYGRERYLANEFIKSKSEQLSETKFYAFYNRKKHTIDGKSLYDAKQKAILKLKVPKSKVGMLSIVNAKEHDRGGFRFEQKLRQTIREIIKEQMNEAYRSQSIFFDKKDKSKLQKLLKKKKGKFPFNPFGEPVVNWSLDDRGSKGIEWSGIPKYNYDKAVEFFMKNKLNPRG